MTNTTTTTKTTTQSIFSLLDSLKTETSVPDQIPKMQPMTIPRDALPTSEQFSDSDKLETWARSNNILHAVLQKGIRSHVIDLRAKFKAVKKGDTWTSSYGQANVNVYTWDVMTKPEGSKLTEAVKQAGMTMAQNMKNAGVNLDIIKTALMPVYGEAGTQEILNDIK